MNNPLLSFVAAVAAHEATRAPLSRFTTFDNLEMEIAISMATRRGLIEKTGQTAPCVRLTTTGKVWAQQMLEPFDHLLLLIQGSTLEAAE